MKRNSEDVSFPRTLNFLRLWGAVAQGMFPFMTEELGEPDETAGLFVTVCESVVKPEEFDYAKWKGIGRPKTSRTAVFKAFLFKALCDVPTTKELARRLRHDVWARRLCGWNRRCARSANPVRPEMGLKPPATGKTPALPCPDVGTSAENPFRAVMRLRRVARFKPQTT